MLVVWESLRTYFLGNILENVNSLECFDEYFPKFEGKAFIFSPFLANIPILNPPENSRNLFFFFFFFLFLSGFSFTNIHDSRDSRGRGRVSV